MTSSLLRWRTSAAAILLALGGWAATAPAVSAHTLSGLYLAAMGAAQRNDFNAAFDFYSKALAMAPEDNLLRTQAINFAVMAGDVKRAAELARGFPAGQAGDQLAEVVLTVDDIAGNRLDDARNRISQNGDAFTSLLSKLLTGWIDYGFGDMKGATKAFDSLDENSLFTMFGKYHLALARAAVGDQTGAEEAFAAAAELARTRTPRMARAEAATLEALGRAADARQVLRDTLDRNRGDESLTLALAQVGTSAAAPIVRSPQDGIAEVMVGLADGLSQGQNNTDLALIYARFAAYLRPDLDEAKLLIAELLNDEDQYDLAIGTYDGIAKDSPFYISAQIGRADSLDRMEKSDEAYDVLRKLATANPKSIRAQKALGDQLRGSERFTEAAAAYSAAIDQLGALEPNDWLLFYQRGISYERSGQWTKGEKDLRQALDLAPDQPLVLNYLGYSMVEQHDSLEEAQKLIEKAVAKRPDDGYITDSLGWVLYRLGKYDEAVTTMERAVQLTPVDPIINDHLGDVLWKVGRKMEARFQWRRALSFDPTPEDAMRIREKLDRGLDAVLEDEAKKAASTTPPATATNGG